MAVVLVDSSVWVLAETRPRILSEQTSEDRVATCPAVMFEVLRGSRDMHRYARAHLVLTKALVLDAPTPQARYEEAAQLYMRCRAEGVTVSSRIDWLIAACAIAYDIPLVHHDNDFEHMARFIPLKTRRVVV